MPRISSDTLRREQEAQDALDRSFISNPIKRAIQELFKNEFSESNYRKLGGISAMRDVALAKLKEASSSIKPGPYSSAAANLYSKVRRANTYEKILTVLNDYLFS